MQKRTDQSPFDFFSFRTQNQFMFIVLPQLKIDKNSTIKRKILGYFKTWDTPLVYLFYCSIWTKKTFSFNV